MQLRDMFAIFIAPLAGEDDELLGESAAEFGHSNIDVVAHSVGSWKSVC
jgi:hypothetical protein